MQRIPVCLTSVNIISIESRNVELEASMTRKYKLKQKISKWALGNYSKNDRLWYNWPKRYFPNLKHSKYDSAKKEKSQTQIQSP